MTDVLVPLLLLIQNF